MLEKQGELSAFVYLLDTNTASELRVKKPHGGVLSWHHAQTFDTLRISSLTVYEMQAGVEKTRRQDAAKADEIERWIAAVERAWTIVTYGPRETRITAKLMAQQSASILVDAMIAATAIANGLTVATRNTQDFEQFQVALVDPFEYRG